MRGAADVSGEGKVTLNEAYQFAFNETLTRTTETQAGAQHPAYHINLSGTGDVVMTDVRQTSAGLLLSEGLSGRFYVINTDQQLVAELYKPAGRNVELGLDPGSYEIILDQTKEILLGTAKLDAGDRLVLGYDHLEPGERELTVLRGAPNTINNTGALPYTLRGRHRIDLNIGWWSTRPEKLDLGSGMVNTIVGSWDILGGLGYSRWLREDLALAINVSALGGEATVTTGAEVTVESLALVSLMVSARKYLPASTLRSGVRPYLTGGVGTFIGNVSKTETGPTVNVTSETMGAFGGQFGGGIDLPMGKYFIIGAKAAYNLVSDFREPLGGRKNYSGSEFSVSLGLMLGKGY
jgi:hypothetical protein